MRGHTELLDVFYTLLPYIPYTEHATLCGVFSGSEEYVSAVRTRAGRLLGRWWRRHHLAPVESTTWTHLLCTKRTLIRHYIARYPEEHMQSCIQAFIRLLQRPELAPPATLSSKRSLRYVLTRCSRMEIMYVGW